MTFSKSPEVSLARAFLPKVIKWAWRITGAIAWHTSSRQPGFFGQTQCFWSVWPTWWTFHVLKLALIEHAYHQAGVWPTSSVASSAQQVLVSSSTSRPTMHWHPSLAPFSMLPNPWRHYDTWCNWSDFEEQQLEWDPCELAIYLDPSFGTDSRTLQADEKAPTVLHMWLPSSL